MSITRAQAIRRYPELSSLAKIKDEGWDFHVLVDEAGEPSCLVGYRSRRQFIDAIYVYDTNETTAIRMNVERPGVAGGIVWQSTGPLENTLEELLALPAPGERFAPVLTRKMGLLLGLG
ncbi:hypothetical protein [Actinoalloteichus hymeniacidonis]|uniref:Uncharacterized protein n=1 Tax=Actinoalloteichus hymeniacidonis TaxID=340345 RepID=A0AAC9N0Q8_9PSEU|nr:hypothetical protein [Actinoalloteichus hymeniacidonis]AOS65357.1 hypothetical protein TL08_22885 [Actinoalloteichus hymeniacidonis]MBB5906557.1 hypothetical protein [Actinoalloteichus hymeniacidonis]